MTLLVFAVIANEEKTTVDWGTLSNGDAPALLPVTLYNPTNHVK